MPIFNLKCEKCGKHFERICKLDEVKDEKCPGCDNTGASLAVSGFGSYTFKGGSGGASVTPKKFRARRG